MGTSRNTGSDKQTYYKLSLCGGVARIEPVAPIPDAELWFETLLAKKRFG